MVQAEGVFLHRFQRNIAVPQKGLTTSGLASGDRVVVSDQEGRLVGLATGYLCEVSRSSISCTLDRWEGAYVHLLSEVCALKNSCCSVEVTDLIYSYLVVSRVFTETCPSSVVCCFDWTVTKVWWASALTSPISPDWWRTVRTGSCREIQYYSMMVELILKKSEKLTLWQFVK